MGNAQSPTRVLSKGQTINLRTGRVSSYSKEAKLDYYRMMTRRVPTIDYRKGR